MRKEDVMKKPRYLVFQAAVFSCLMAVSVADLAAKPADSGNGGGGGGGSAQPDYGDLFVLYRYPSGVPILTEDLCQQPLAKEEFAGCEETTDGDCLLIPVDPATCTVLPEYAILTQEIEFGRTSVVRSSDDVFDAQLEEALLSLNTAGCISLDPAGRLVYSSVINDAVETHTIDSPLQNLAIYRELVKGNASQIPLKGNWLDTAARALGAAVDKTGKISVDMVVYLNQILGLNEQAEPPAPLSQECIDVREEVKGNMEIVNKCFLTFGNDTEYVYDRTQNFLSLPSPPYIPAEAPQPGYFEYLYEDSPGIYMIAQGPILAAVPELQDEQTLISSKIEGFAQAADDTRAVIEFMHLWPVIGDMVTPVTCKVAGDVYYDLSISDQSGLQVPVRMVADTEGREGSLTITNAGPAMASGTVTLIGEYADGRPVELHPLSATYQRSGEDVFAVALHELDTVTAVAEDLTFFDDNDESFENLPAGHSQTWTFSFSVDTATTVHWVATVTADPADDDVNLTNNTVTEETKVTASKGSGK